LQSTTKKSQSYFRKLTKAIVGFVEDDLILRKYLFVRSRYRCGEYFNFIDGVNLFDFVFLAFGFA